MYSLTLHLGVQSQKSRNEGREGGRQETSRTNIREGVLRLAMDL